MNESSKNPFSIYTGFPDELTIYNNHPQSLFSPKCDSEIILGFILKNGILEIENKTNYDLVIYDLKTNELVRYKEANNKISLKVKSLDKSVFVLLEKENMMKIAVSFKANVIEEYEAFTKLQFKSYCIN